METFRCDLREAPLLLCVATVPLIFAAPLYDSYVLPKLWGAAAWLAAASWLGLARTGSDGENAASGPALLREPLGRSVLALLAAALVSSLFSADRWTSWIGQERFYSYSLLGWGLCAWAFARSADVPAKDFSRRLASWALWGAIPVSLYAVYQWHWRDPYGVTDVYLENRTAVRSVSTLGGPVQLGAYLAVIAPLAAHRLWLSRGRERLLGAAALALVSAALIATGTRSAWLGAAAGVGVSVAAANRGRRLPRVARIAGAAFLIACVLGGFHRVSRRKSDRERLEVWSAAGRIFRDRPLLGAGPDMFGFAFRSHRSRAYAELTGGRGAQQDAHNDWLQIAATLGILGLAAYAWLHKNLVQLACGLWRRDLSFGTGAILGSLAAFFVQTKFNTTAWAALLLCAVFVGSLVATTRFARPPAGGASRLAALAARFGWATAVFAVGVFALLSRMMWADFNEGKGMRARREGRPREAAAHLERAVALNGWSASYRGNLANLLWDVAETEAENRRILLARAAEVAWEGVRRHPADSMSYWLLGRAELRRCRWGGEAGRLEPARLALEAAVGMNPFFGPIRQDLDDAMKGAKP